MAAPIAYGADWSARQIHGEALSRFRYTDPAFQQWPLSFVLRYADFDGQRHAVLTKDEYESHLAAGIRSLLIYQRTTRDPDGGETRGRDFARAAVAYARTIGYRLGEPIFATADAPIGAYNLDVAEAFFRGFAAVVREAGYLAGGYGFRDVIYRLQDRGVVDVLWLCGAESGWRSGIAIYQWNNGRIYPSGVEADLVKQFEPIPGGDDMAGALDEPIGVWGQERTTTLRTELAWLPQNFANIDGRLAGLTAAVSALAAGDVTAERLDHVVGQAVDKAVAEHTPTAEQVAEAQRPFLREAMREVLGEDNDDQADEILRRMGDKLASAAQAAS